MHAPASAFPSRQGREFIDFSRRVIEIVIDTPFGVDQEIFLLKYYSDGIPSEVAKQNFEWEEFKRARDYSNQRFDNREEGWIWMRARRGLLPGQFYYQAVAKIVDGEPEMVISYPISEQLYMQKHSEWMTRTKSEMRVMVANIQAKKQAALKSGRKELLLEAENDFDQIIMLSPRLAAINFDTGLTVTELQQLAKSTKIPRLLQKTVKQTLDSYEKSQNQVRKLSQVVYDISQMRKRKGKRR